MPTTYDDIKATSFLRSRYGRRKKGMFEGEARYAGGEASRPGSAAAKKFARQQHSFTIISKDDGTFVLVDDDEDK